MVQRVYPQEYFQVNNDFKEGLKWGAFLILVGIVVGAAIVYMGMKK